ncbi:sigma-E factor negative regulatory protein [Halomonas sp. V046]|uniref:sigma-E factor negative regulatory protein n=1 Tax=Halomonas sp. V046 TaxID=3459611 RepID=UPI00404446B7
MSLNARESLSALMDNEGDELELRRVLKSLETDGDAASAWRRYHLMRASMRRESDMDPSVDLSAGIMARLADEPAPLLDDATAGRAGRVASLPFARGAGIAAAVSLMVISGVQFYNGSFSGSAGSAPAGAGSELATGTQASSPSAVSTVSAGGAELAAARPSLIDLPMFQSSGGGNSGLMTVGASPSSPMFMSPSSEQSARADQAQARLLQSYLDRHAQGAAFSSADSWMPMVRALPGETADAR